MSQHQRVRMLPARLRADAAEPIANIRIVVPVDADLVVISYNNESWVTIDELEKMARARGGAVRTLAFESRRYVGAQIGIHNPRGEKVGQISHLKNVEYLVCAGEPEIVEGLWRSQAMSRS